MLEAITIYGSFKGMLLGIKRILRCHPFGKKGYDPVPIKKEKKMKKAKLLMGILVITILLSGCSFTKQSDKIYTTNYPITFITSYLLGDNEDVESIYPNDINQNEYKLTPKLIKQYSSGNVFVYNGLSNEKEYAKKLVNTNHQITIIDAGENINYEYDITETWLSPNNFMMLTKNVKDRLIEYSTSQDEIKTINENFKTLEIEISNMDAYLRNIAKEATKDNISPIIISATGEFRYLEDYGFTIIALDDNISDNNLATIKANFKNKKYKNILAFNGYKNSELVSSLVNDCDAKIVNANPIYSLSNDDIAKNENYITLMNSYLELIKNIVV